LPVGCQALVDVGAGKGAIMQEISVWGLVYGKTDRFIAVVSFFLGLGLYLHGGRLGLGYVPVFLVNNRQYRKSEAAL
ncbi:MAG: hypothetical protein ACE10K_05080, partial [Rhodothermales bacterium]